MKSVMGVVILVAGGFLWASRGIVAAEVTQPNWVQFQADPEPASQLTSREKFDAHLTRVDRSLALLRFVYREQEKCSPEHRRDSRQCAERLQGAYEFVGMAKKDLAFASASSLADQLVEHLKRAESIAHNISQGKELTPEMFGALQTARGFVKMVRHQLQGIKLKPAENLITVSRTELRTHRSDLRPAVIIDPALDIPPAKAYLPHPIGVVLLQLAVLSAEQRTEFARRIVEDQDTHVLEMRAVPAVTDTDSPSYFVLVSKRMELPDGETRIVQLPFRLTIQRVETEGLRNVLRILANTTSEAGVRVRNTLLTEVPVTSDLSVTACDTCVSFFPSRDAEHRGQTAVSFAANAELTFYSRTTGRIRDVSYRSIAASKSRSALEQTKRQGVIRASDELARLISQAVESLPTNPPVLEPAIAAGGDSRISPVDQDAHVGP